jgi:addiction module HigA family antidote
MTTKLKPVSPGEMLAEEFLKPLGMSNYRFAKEIGVPPQRIGDILANKRAIPAVSRLAGLLVMIVAIASQAAHPANRSA